MLRIKDKTVNFRQKIGFQFAITACNLKWNNSNALRLGICKLYGLD